MTTQGACAAIIETPHGTVTIYASSRNGKIQVFCEPEPHPADWRKARKWIMAHSDGRLFDSYTAGRLDVFEVFLRPGVLPSTP